jgi:DNA-binding response OmpR family regulator
MAGPKRILLVDSNAVLRASLAEQLAGHYEIATAGSLADARAAAGPFALAVIDQHLPDGSGEALAAELRGSGLAAGVLLLVEEDAGSSNPERMAKPFRFAGLLARIEALVGRHGGDAAAAIGPYLFRPSAKLLTEGTRKIRLTEKETNILKFLLETAGTVPRQTLLHEVWGYNPAVTTHTLETHIYRLRRKIEENPGEAKILVTEEGGYRLAGANV